MLKITDLKKLDNGKYVCPYCNKEFSKNGVCTHIWRIHTDDGEKFNSKLIDIKSNNIPWNKGLNKEIDDRLKKASNTYKERIKNGEIVPSFKGKKHTKETIELMKNKCGGYRMGSNRSISGWYKNIWCDSTYELCWVIYQLEHGNNPVRYNSFYEYFYNGITHKYYPDFIMDDIIYEIKGYETKKDLIKYKSITDKKLIVLKSKDMKYIFDYIKEKYKTQNYYELYDFKKKEPKDLKHNLCVCGSIKHKNAKLCDKCYKKSIRKVERPSYEQLQKNINETNYSATGRKYGVSDNTIRKWIKIYEKNSK